MNNKVRREQLPESNEIVNNYAKLKNVKWLWHSDYYDGPCSGMVERNGQKYWAFWFDEETWVEQDDQHRARFYAILKLTDKQLESEEYWHWLFNLCVGYECDYVNHSSQLNTNGTHWTKKMQTFFYSRRKAEYKELDLSEPKLIGWFVY